MSRFTSPIAGIPSAPNPFQPTDFVFGEKRTDGFYMKLAGTNTRVKVAQLNGYLTNEGVAYAARATFPGDLAITMTAIAMAESTNDAFVVSTRPNRNGTHDYGLFQINSSHAAAFNGLANWWKPTFNAAMARRLYDESLSRKGTQTAALREQWSSYASGRHLVYIPTAKAAMATVGGAIAPEDQVQVPVTGLEPLDDLENWTDPNNEDGLAGEINKTISNFVPYFYIAGGALLVTLGAIMIVRKQT